MRYGILRILRTSDNPRVDRLDRNDPTAPAILERIETSRNASARVAESSLNLPRSDRWSTKCVPTGESTESWPSEPSADPPSPCQPLLTSTTRPTMPESSFLLSCPRIKRFESSWRCHQKVSNSIPSSLGVASSPRHASPGVIYGILRRTSTGTPPRTQLRWPNRIAGKVPIRSPLTHLDSVVGGVAVSTMA